MTSKRWLIKTPNPQGQVLLSNSLNIHPLLAQLLINRGIETTEEARIFLSSDISKLHDPFLLKDMARAVKRIQAAQARGETVLIFGDYDVDGVTSSVLLKETLKKLGIQAVNYIPHRMTEGYGLNLGIVNQAKEKGVRLLITVDCGINAFEEVAALNQAEIDVIIIDHHEPSAGKLPEAAAVINPKREDCSYPFKSLAAVGLVLKLSQALGLMPEEYLDLVAIGTIADVAELRGENRIFIKEGLPKVGVTRNRGLKALLEIAKLKDKRIKPHYIGFIIGPRLNATGRMGSARESLALLLSETDEEAQGLAKSLEAHNSSRQKIQSEIIQEALSIVEREVNFKDHRVIVVEKQGWHRGVLGIVASRIVEKYYRPTVVISTDGQIGTGSARSIDGFHLFEALTHCSGLLENFGGHKRAAGLTVRAENIEKFRFSINEFAKNTVSVEQLTPTLDIDAEIPLSLVNMQLIEMVESMEPFGEGNPAPLFCSRRLQVKSPPAVAGKETIKFWVADGPANIQAVGFGLARWADEIKMNQWVDLAYAPAIDDWNKAPTVILKIKDIKLSAC